jgi:hypothetical protein
MVKSIMVLLLLLLDSAPPRAIHFMSTYRLRTAGKSEHVAGAKRKLANEASSPYLIKLASTPKSGPRVEPSSPSRKEEDFLSASLRQSPDHPNES